MLYELQKDWEQNRDKWEAAKVKPEADANGKMPSAIGYALKD
jgi:hypothetical protein